MQSVWALDNDTVIKDFISELSDQLVALFRKSYRHSQFVSTSVGTSVITEPLLFGEATKL